LLIPKEWIGLLGLLPIAIGIHQFIHRNDEDEPEIQAVSYDVNSAAARHTGVSMAATLLTPQTYSVAAVTIANGGDNIGIYVPLFASFDLPMLGITLVVFLVLIAVWCGIAYRLARFPAIAHVLTRYGHAIVPFVLIGLGLFIVIESKTYRLFAFL
jgi:cadmium resistance protein CadD (predicted permease)